jgi:SpoVK/Ycf46/Vps4 family AAA+-type ATPase
MPGIERIAQNINPANGNRFFVLYGGGIEDVFISAELHEINIEQALLQTLKQAGFNRVAFISPHRPLYFLDPDSTRYSLPIKNKAADPLSKMHFLNEGPMGDVMIFKNEILKDETVYDGVGDVHAIRTLDAMMKDGKELNTAVVFIQAETVLSFFDDSRSIAGIVGEWARLPATNRNICLFVFSANSYSDLCNLTQNLVIPELRHFILRRDNPLSNPFGLAYIGGPEINEVKRFFEFYSQMSQVVIEGKDTNILWNWIAAEGELLRTWISRFNQVEKIDLNVAVKSNWFSAVRDPKRTARERLDMLVGLKDIKKRVKEMAAWMEYCQIKNREDTANDFPLMHMIFVGAPGTGKTTVARLIGEMYHEIGILKRGQLIEAKAGDLVGEYVGATAIKTSQILDRAMDGVLFIDEAYALTEEGRGGFGQEAVETLLSRLEEDRGRLVVIAAGYPDQMKRFRKSNPGLLRRFPEENVFPFPDYSPDELLLIFKKMLSNRNLYFSADVEGKIEKMIKGMYDNRDENFGNAGEIRNVVDSLERQRAVRIKEDRLSLDVPVLAGDFPESLRSYMSVEVPDVDSVLGELESFTGMIAIKKYIRRIANQAQLEKIKKNDEQESVTSSLQHLVFSGNPGTGKTTVARMLGKIYKALGLLRKGHCVEVSRGDLVAGYVGQTSLMTMNKIQESLDGILFIDEAYSLTNGSSGNDFGREAIDTLVKAMEDYRGRLVIIAAGYPVEMQRFINSNPGLRSRFNVEIDFPDFSLDEQLKILSTLIYSEGYLVSGEVLSKAGWILEDLQKRAGNQYGNGRAVRSLFQEMKACLADRIINQRKIEPLTGYSPDLFTFSPWDFPAPYDLVMANPNQDPVISISSPE